MPTSASQKLGAKATAISPAAISAAVMHTRKEYGRPCMPNVLADVATKPIATLA